ncbi:MAG: DUF58 domain-containing protein, partial [Actinomycetota bacterium]
MSPTPRTAVALGVIALATLVLPVELVAITALAFAVTAVVDALAVRKAPQVDRLVPPILSRGIPSPVHLVAHARPGAHGDIRVRQAVPPDVSVTPPEADFELAAEIVARRRGRHVLPPPATRTDGPIGLGRWYHRGSDEHELLSYPDLPNARRLALAVRQGRFRESGRITRGPLGLGTDFESIREYLPDDDIRQVNWQATARVGRPMSNQYR